LSELLIDLGPEPHQVFNCLSFLHMLCSATATLLGHRDDGPRQRGTRGRPSGMARQGLSHTETCEVSYRHLVLYYLDSPGVTYRRVGVGAGM
jgi:hypothetical protein